MNQTHIFRLAKILLQESNQDITEALEPLITDHINQPWNNEEIGLVLCAELDLLTEDEALQLQQTLDQSFDTTHPDFCKELALANLRRSFIEPVDLCKECLHIKHQDELDQHNGYCIEYAVTTPPIFDPEAILEESDTSVSNSKSDTIPNETNDPLPETRPATPLVEINSSPPITSSEPDISLSVMLQLQQQVAHQSQLIRQLQQKVEALETFNQQLIQM